MKDRIKELYQKTPRWLKNKYILSAIIFFLSFFLSVKLDDSEKLSAYECGFNPFSDSRVEFDVKFYIVAILFIVFDLEIIFLCP